MILADIQLTDGLSFEIFSRVAVTSPVIFTTAYDEYAIRAFKYNSVDYLLKPVEKDELAVAMEKARCQQKPVDALEHNRLYSDLMDYIGGKPVYRERFLIPFRDGYRIVRTAEVNHFTSIDKITRAYLPDGNFVVVPQTLEELETELNPNSFFRANRQFIVHVDSIERIVNYLNFRLKIKLCKYSDKEIIVSRDKASLLKDWVNR